MKHSPPSLNPAAPAPFVVSVDAPGLNGRARGAPGGPAEALLPARERWPELLGLEDPGAVEEILHEALLDPVGSLNSAPGKRIRGRLVELSFRLLDGGAESSVVARKRCRLAAEAIELIHAGSLIVDDIEDGSTVRRGRPALHLRYPRPIALNAGNWLYFWPFELLKELAVSRRQLVHIYEACHRTLLRAHFGQAIDLGARTDRVDQTRVKDISLATMRLKTGALTGLAALLGAAVTEKSEGLLPVFDDFGRDLGVALQMFDDLGNVLEKSPPAKRYEDFVLARPSWVWACAAARSTAGRYQRFLAAVKRLPDPADLEAWMAESRILEAARLSARDYLDRSFDILKQRMDAAGVRCAGGAWEELRVLGEEIAVAYE